MHHKVGRDTLGTEVPTRLLHSATPSSQSRAGAQMEKCIRVGNASVAINYFSF